MSPFSGGAVSVGEEIQNKTLSNCSVLTGSEWRNLLWSTLK